jgi:hypothetical protein
MSHHNRWKIHQVALAIGALASASAATANPLRHYFLDESGASAVRAQSRGILIHKRDGLAGLAQLHANWWTLARGDEARAAALATARDAAGAPADGGDPEGSLAGPWAARPLSARGLESRAVAAPEAPAAHAPARSTGEVPATTAARVAAPPATPRVVEPVAPPVTVRAPPPLPVPEPATLGLVGLGVVGAAFLRRKAR